jgi:hypothetical protein
MANLDRLANAVTAPGPGLPVRQGFNHRRMGHFTPAKTDELEHVGVSVRSLAPLRGGLTPNATLTPIGIVRFVTV